MFAIGNGSGESERTRERAEPGSSEPRRRVPFVRIGIVLAATAAVVGAFALRPAPGPLGTPETASAAVVVQRALSAVSTATPAGADVVLHVVATTDFVEPTPPTPRNPPQSQSEGIRHGSVPIPRPTGVHIESEHWLDEARRRRHSVATSTLGEGGDRWFNELLVQDGTRTFVHSQKPSRGEAITYVTETDDGDWLTLGDPSMGDAQDQSPEQQLMDASNPLVYRSLIASGTLVPPRNAAPWRVVTRTTLLSEPVVDGVPVYRVRIDSTSYAGETDSVDSTVSLVADLRRSDYLPLRVRGEWAGQTWTTIYRVVEWVPADKLPAGAFGLGAVTGATLQSNRRVKPGTVASSTAGATVLWLGTQFEGLRFTGQFRTIRNEDEYEVMAEIGSAAVMADQSRPRVNMRYFVAEYTPDARPGNMTTDLTETTVKVITMPLTDASTWERAFTVAASQMTGDRTPPDWVLETTWTQVGGKRALMMHHRFTYGDGSVNGRIHPTFDYLVFDSGKSTVMVQGACAKPGQVLRAAEALIRAE